jgi:hypothetical protein
VPGVTVRRGRGSVFQVVREGDHTGLAEGGVGGLQEVGARFDAGEFGRLAEAVEERRHLGATKLSRRWTVRAHLTQDRRRSGRDGPPAGVRLSKNPACDQPATKGKAGGKLPAGKGASRFPCRRASEAVRKALTNSA